MPLGGLFLPLTYRETIRREAEFTRERRNIAALKEEAAAAAMRRLRQKIGNHDVFVDKWVEYCMIEDEELEAVAIGERVIDIALRDPGRLNDASRHGCSGKKQRERKNSRLTQVKKLLLTVDSMEAYMALFGLNDQNVALIEQECGVTVALRGSELIITGEAEDTELAGSVIAKLVEMIGHGDLVDRSRIRYAIALAREGQGRHDRRDFAQRGGDHPPRQAGSLQDAGNSRNMSRPSAIMT